MNTYQSYNNEHLPALIKTTFQITISQFGLDELNYMIRSHCLLLSNLWHRKFKNIKFDIMNRMKDQSYPNKTKRIILKNHP